MPERRAACGGGLGRPRTVTLLSLLLCMALAACGDRQADLNVDVGGGGIAVALSAATGDHVLWGAADLTNFDDAPIVVESVQLISLTGEAVTGQATFMLIDGYASTRPGIDTETDMYSDHLHDLNELRLEVPDGDASRASQAGLVVVFSSQQPRIIEVSAVEITLKNVETGAVDTREVDATARICFEQSDSGQKASGECGLIQG